MIKYTNDALKEILESHEKWLKNNEDGCRANLDCADLRGINFSHVNLSRANLMQSNLCGADLRGANLEGALLTGAKLMMADFREANLKNADLRYTDLHGAGFSEANLELAELERANLNRTDFRWANLKGTDFTDAELYGARLDTAIMSDDTRINFPLACPDQGAFIGWKKCHLYIPLNGTDLVTRKTVIVKLHILNTSRRSSATSRKCRCDRAEVLDIQDMHGNSLVCEELDDGRIIMHDDVVAYSTHDPYFTYEVGKIVSEDEFDKCRWNECAPGIHFFITRQEAVEY